MLARPVTCALAVLLSTGCYLAHRIEDPPDADIGDGGVHRRNDSLECCLSVACGDEVCGEGEECTGRGCEPSCEGPRCGGLCCPAGELCVGGACTSPGPRCTSDRDCAGDRRCDDLARACVPPPTTSCYRARPFEPELAWEVPIDSISVPIVAQLGDDDGDGRVTARDTPDLVVIELPDHPDADARLVALSGDDGRILWTAGDDFTAFCSHSTAASGDLDGDGDVEIAVLASRIEPHVHVGAEPRWRCAYPPHEDDPCPVFPPDRGPFHEHGPSVDSRYRHTHPENACSTFADTPGSLLVYSRDGELERMVPLPLRASPTRRTHQIALADLDADGVPEVVASGTIIGAEGVRWADERLAGVSSAIGDIDLDGRMEIVTTERAFDDDGSVLWTRTGIAADGHVAIARVVPSPMSAGPQVVAVDGGLLVVRDGATGEALIGPIRFAAGVSSGPPTIADFDGDGEAEIGIAADHAYVVFDFELPAPHVRWRVDSEDRTPGTVGASAFDFDGDGAADVAYSDECHAVLLSGRDGNPLWARANPSRTVWEYPIVADLDNDGHAELAVVANERSPDQPEELGCYGRVHPYGRASGGVRVFRDRLAHWAGTRPTWNQHGYDQSVGLEGALPVEPPRPWQTHNSVRANPWYGGDGARPLPDLRVAAVRSLVAACGDDDVVLEARIENRGNVAVPPGVEVRFGEATAVRTSQLVLPGGATWVRSAPIERRRLRGLSVEARVDPRDAVRECDETSASRLALDLACEP